MIGGLGVFVAFPPKVSFFPTRDPNYIYLYLKLPEGTSADYTFQVAQVAYARVKKALGEKNPLVKSILVNVGVGAGDPFDRTTSASPNRAKITIAFVEFRQRKGQSTRPYLEKVLYVVQDLPGVEIRVEPDRAGPPVGKPVSIEIASEDPQAAIRTALQLKRYLDSLRVPGVQDLQSDLVLGRPEIRVRVDRDRVLRAGLSSAQIGSELRTALFGKEASKYRELEDEYPIQIRYDRELPGLSAPNSLAHKITFRDMSDGRLKQLPLANFVSLEYTSGSGLIRRKNLKRTITLSSDVLPGYNRYRSQ
jgi:multidrug efflux pump